MKRFKFFALMLLCAALSFPAFANNGNNSPDGKVIIKTSVDGKDLTLHLANLQKNRTTVSLLSLDGNARYYRGVIQDHNGYSQGMDLGRLPNGKYKLQVNNDSEVYTKVLKVEGDQVFVSK